MAFWTSQRVEREQIDRAKMGKALIHPFDPERIKQGAYELALSHQAVATSSGTGGTNVPGHPKAFKIDPGQFAVLYTFEEVKVPDNVIAFISVKSSFKGDGLINVSGFHVDPGYEGRLRFSVYNAGSRPLFLVFGRPTFQMWFAEMDADTRDPYPGSREDRLVVTSKDLELTQEQPASPAALNERLRDLERKWEKLQSLRILFFYPILVSIIAAFFAVVLTLLVGLTQTIITNAAKPPPQASSKIP